MSKSPDASSFLARAKGGVKRITTELWGLEHGDAWFQIISVIPVPDGVIRLQLSDGTQSCGASISIAVEPEGERKGPLARLDVVNLKAWQRLPQDPNQNPSMLS